MRNKLKTALQNATNTEKARPRNLLGTMEETEAQHKGQHNKDQKQN